MSSAVKLTLCAIISNYNMTAEKNNPQVNALETERNKVKLGEVVNAFKAGIDIILNREKERIVLFEGDFILARDVTFSWQIDIGDGLSVNSTALFMKFLGAIRERGNVTSLTSIKDRGFLEGETDASRYFRAKLSQDKFPIERTSLIVKTNSGSELLIKRDKFYYADGQGTPLTERWIVQNKDLPDLSVI